jgi:hypothetical protein
MTLPFLASRLMPRLARMAQSPSIRAMTTRWISDVPE